MIQIDLSLICLYLVCLRLCGDEAKLSRPAFFRCCCTHPLISSIEIMGSKRASLSRGKGAIVDRSGSKMSSGSLHSRTVKYESSMLECHPRAPPFLSWLQVSPSGGFEEEADFSVLVLISLLSINQDQYATKNQPLWIFNTHGCDICNQKEYEGCSRMAHQHARLDLYSSSITYVFINGPSYIMTCSTRNISLQLMINSLWECKTYYHSNLSSVMLCCRSDLCFLQSGLSISTWIVEYWLRHWSRQYTFYCTLDPLFFETQKLSALKRAGIGTVHCVLGYKRLLHLGHVGFHISLKLLDCGK